MDNLRNRVGEDHPLRKMFTPTDQRRAEKEVGDIFDFAGSALEPSDVDVKPPKSTGAARVEPSGYLGDEKFDAFKNQAKASEKLGYNPMGKTNYVKEQQLDSERPLQAHASRSDDAIQTDIEKKATVTTDPELYAEHPDRYDYPFIDTPKEFKDEFGDKSFAALERKAGEDELFTW